MTRLMIALCAVGIFVAGSFAVTTNAKDTAYPDKSATKVAMAKAMKGGLCKKVAGGDATDAEKAELLKLFTAMSKDEVKKGDAASWKAKTKALVDAAQGSVDGNADAGAALTKAMDCKACHSVHK